jgi:hypothetical protein
MPHAPTPLRFPSSRCGRRRRGGCCRTGRAGVRNGRHQGGLDDPRIFDRNIASALDPCRLGRIRVRVHCKPGVSQPRYANGNFVIVAKHIPISIRQRFFCANDRDIRRSRMLLRTEPPEGDRLQLSVWRDFLRGRHISTGLELTRATQEEA